MTGSDPLSDVASPNLVIDLHLVDEFLRLLLGDAGLSSSTSTWASWRTSLHLRTTVDLQSHFPDLQPRLTRPIHDHNKDI